MQRVHRTGKQTVLINLPNFPVKRAKKNYSKSKRNVTATKFSTGSIFPQIVSWETSKVAWLRCWSFSVKLLNFFRFKSEKYAKLEVFQKKVPNCFSQKRRIQFWQLCGSTFAKTARRSHSKEEKTLKSKGSFFLQLFLWTCWMLFREQWWNFTVKTSTKACSNLERKPQILQWNQSKFSSGKVR